MMPRLPFLKASAIASGTWASASVAHGDLFDLSVGLYINLLLLLELLPGLSAEHPYEQYYNYYGDHRLQ